MTSDTFEVLFLIARPAAGKSEIIDYLSRTSVGDRKRRFHIGPITVLDDFPMIWAWFDEDHILQEMGHPRVHTDAGENFRHPYLWDVLIKRLGLEYAKLLHERPDYHAAGGTAIVEFSRGAQHGGFCQAFAHVPPEMLGRGAILYVNVSWEESLRKNRTRFNPARPHSILEHALPDAKLAKCYRDSDWEAFSATHSECIPIQGVPVPYAVFENEDDVTTGRGEALSRRLEQTLGVLWKRWDALHNKP